MLGCFLKDGAHLVLQFSVAKVSFFEGIVVLWVQQTLLQGFSILLFVPIDEFSDSTRNVFLLHAAVAIVFQRDFTVNLGRIRSSSAYTELEHIRSTQFITSCQLVFAYRDLTETAGLVPIICEVVGQ